MYRGLILFLWLACNLSWLYYRACPALIDCSVQLLARTIIGVDGQNIPGSERPAFFPA
jgi:hypothetical protein